MNETFGHERNFCSRCGKRLGKNASPNPDDIPRQWVGLTDEEIVEGQRESWVDKQAWESAVWWAEAKLKEKNHEPVAWREALALALQALKPRPGMPNPEYQSLMECAIEAIEEVQSRPEQEPQRQWVGLTEEDFSAINQSCLTKLQAATSAESILKEKNT